MVTDKISLNQTFRIYLTFEERLKNVFNKINKTTGLLRKLSNLLPRQALVTIYKAFVRPHLDYGDVLYDQAFDNSFHVKIESMQFTATIRGTSREKIYQELGLEFLNFVVGTENFVSFIKFSKMSIQNTFLIPFL